MKKKNLFTAMVAVAMTMAMSVTAFAAGWVENGVVKTQATGQAGAGNEQQVTTTVDNGGYNAYGISNTALINKDTKKNFQPNGGSFFAILK